MKRKKKANRARRSNERGQVSIMIALMLATLLIFFQFVVNIGLLVNAKINLQNAADLAAFSGASAQARNLNRIAWLNYEMRRHYKKFLFRYYVIGNMFQDSHPKVSVTDSNLVRQWLPGSDSGMGNIGVPSVCMAFDEASNFCRNRVLSSGTPPNTPPPLDPIGQVLAQQLSAFEALRQNDCVSLAEINANILGYWLFNTDPTLEGFEALLEGIGGQSDPQFKALKTIKTVVTGLGLVPKLAILSSRINTLSKIINTEPKVAMDVNELISLQTNQDLLSLHEASVLAFKSAYFTLGEHLFDSRSIKMTEFTPIGEEGADLVRLNPVKINFETWFTDLHVLPNNVNVPSTGETLSQGSCLQVPKKIVLEDFTVGFTKDPTRLTYYAIRIDGDLNLMFTPFGNQTLKLSAYAAAQPFGSRIGPAMSQNMLVHEAAPNINNIPVNSGVDISCPDCAGVPNIGLLADEQLKNISTGGFWKLYSQSAFYNAMTSTSDVFALQNTLTLEDMNLGYQAAMAPNPAEKGLYQFPNDLGQESAGSTGSEIQADPFNRRFASIDSGPNQVAFFKFWAPITMPGEDESGAQEQIENTIKDALSFDTQNADLLANNVNKYINSLKDDQENAGDPLSGITYNLASISNPFVYGPDTRFGGQNKRVEIDSAGQLLMDEISDVRSAWSDLRVDDVRADGVSQNFRSRGRNGYSVKYVSFRYLMNPGQGGSKANSESDDAWTNPPLLDSNARQEIGPAGEFIDH